MARRFDAAVHAIGPERWAAMLGASRSDDPRCPEAGDLALVTMDHWTFEGGVARGELVVAAAVADEVVTAFGRIFAAGFPIARMTPVDAFGGDDERSMAANNCSAFNFRIIAGTDQLSNHAFGLAIDINPVQNPWIRGETVLPPSGASYLDRDHVRPGMIVRPGPVTDAFDAAGWYWGGDWTTTRDYHHFARNPR